VGWPVGLALGSPVLGGLSTLAGWLGDVLGAGLVVGLGTVAGPTPKGVARRDDDGDGVT
jgi:hypothetical protein